MISITPQKQNYLKLISSIFSLIFIFLTCIYNPQYTKVKAAELNSIKRKSEEIKNISVYEEKKITLNVQKNVPDIKGRAKIDFEILVDASGSMRDSGSIEKLKEVLKNFIDSRNPNYDRISITTFRGPGYYAANDPRNYEEHINTIYKMGNNFDDAKIAIDAIKFGGFTPLLSGLDKSKLNLDNSGSAADRKILIILSDGHPNVGPERDFYYRNAAGGYYGKYPEYYPGEVIKKQVTALLEQLNNNEISYNEYDEQNLALLEQQNLYPEAEKVMFTDTYVSETQKNLKGIMYDNSKPEFYDLKYLIMKKMSEIKNAGYEVFSVFLDNEKPRTEGYKDFLANTKETEKLFKEIAKDDNHYFYSQNVSGLPQAFQDVKNTINTFDYFVNDTIEDGFELMSDTLKASQNGVIPSVNGKNITWDISGVPYKDLEVSYHIKREIPSGSLKVRYVDEATGEDIINPILSTEPLNQAYTTENKVLSGYEYVKVVGSENGTYVPEITEVIYYYRKQANIGENVIKQDTSGGKRLEEESNEKLDSKEASTKDIDSIHSIKHKNFGKYELEKVKGTGKDSNRVSKLAYYYKKKVKVPIATNQIKITTKIELPKTGDTITYANYVLGLLFLALGLYTFKRK